MTPKNTADADDDDAFGVLDDTASLDTASLGLLGGTAQVAVNLPTGDDDDLDDDGIVDDEIDTSLLDTSALDTSALPLGESVAQIAQNGGSFVIELPAGEPEADDAREAVPEPADDVVVAEIVETGAQHIVPTPATDAADERVEARAEATVEEAEADAEDAVESDAESADVTVEDADAVGTEDAEAESADAEDVEEASEAPVTAEIIVDDIEFDDDAEDTHDAEPADDLDDDNDLDDDLEEADLDDVETGEGDLEEADLDDVELGEDGVDAEADEPTAGAPSASESRPEDLSAVEVAPITGPATPTSESTPAAPSGPGASSDPDTRAARTGRAAAASAPAEESGASIALVASPLAPTPPSPALRAPAIRPEEKLPVDTDDRTPVARPMSEVPLASKRLDDLGEASRESADLLTADRLLDPHRVAKPEPEGTWSHLLYTLSGRTINIGDGRRARERKELLARISAPMTGSARFVPVLSRKGGVGKTTVTALLGMALADARDDRVIAVDANPDRGTLAERVVGSHGKSVRDLVRQQHEIRGYHDVSALVARDETRLDVLASDADPRVSEAFGDSDYRDVATVAAQYYSLVLTDSGTGIVHSVMDATLDLADQIVIVSGLSVDEARLASETLTWLETNGRAELAREAIVVLNQSTPGAPMVRLNELEAHFSTRAKHVVRVPYDPQVAGGGAIDFGSLRPETRQAARELAARLVEGLRARGA